MAQVTVRSDRRLKNPSEYEKVVGILHAKYPDVIESDFFKDIAEAREAGDISESRAVELCGSLALEKSLAESYRDIGTRAFFNQLTHEDRAMLEFVIDVSLTHTSE